MRPNHIKFPRGARLGVAYWLYQGVAHVLLFPMLLLFLLRAKKEPLYRAHFLQRLGFSPKIPAGAVWVFAASLGETRAVSSLVHTLLEDGQRVIFTHSSPAGLSEGARLFAGDIAKGRVTQTYVPLDLFWALRLFLYRTRPVLGLIVESEIWPAMLFEAARAKLPMIQVNGNYPERSFQRDKRRWGGLRLRLFQGFSQVLTKSEAHRRRYLGAGVPPNRIHLVGELKFDQAIDPAQTTAAETLKQTWPKARKTLLIASSVEAEEPALREMIATLRAKMDTPPLIIWAPRSPQRFDAVAKTLSAAGHQVARRTTCLDSALGGTIPDDTDILVGNSLGEMNFYYSLADLVFVGASLNNDGGHNIIEPLALGKPVVMGPSIFGISFPAHEAQAAGAFESLPHVHALTARILDLFSQPGHLDALANKAVAFHDLHTGAAARSVHIISAYLLTNRQHKNE